MSARPLPIPVTSYKPAFYFITRSISGLATDTLSDQVASASIFGTSAVPKMPISAESQFGVQAIAIGLQKVIQAAAPYRDFQLKIGTLHVGTLIPPLRYLDGTPRYLVKRTLDGQITWFDPAEYGGMLFRETEGRPFLHTGAASIMALVLAAVFSGTFAVVADQ